MARAKDWQITPTAANRAPGEFSATRPARSARSSMPWSGLATAGERLLESAGLGGPVLADPDGRVPCDAVSALFAAAMAQKRLANFGARLAQATPVGAYALFDYLVLTSETVGAAITQAARYLRLTEAPYTIELKTGEDPIRVVYDAQNAITTEYAITLTVLRCREEAEKSFNVQSARFSHALDDTGAMEQILRCPVYAQASWAGIRIRPGHLEHAAATPRLVVAWRPRRARR
jgi:hypothetical protein